MSWCSEFQSARAGHPLRFDDTHCSRLQSIGGEEELSWAGSLPAEFEDYNGALPPHELTQPASFIHTAHTSTN